MATITRSVDAEVAWQPGRGLALFDLDRTLVPGSSLLELARAWTASGHSSATRMAGAVALNAVFARRGIGVRRSEQVRDAALAEVAGYPVEAMTELAHAVGERVAAGAFPAATWLVGRHRAAGDVCVVLSASPHELVAVVAAALGAHHGVGTRGEVHDGLYTGRLDGAFCHGAGKLARLEADLGQLDLGDATAYGDSLSDLPVLRACRHPVAVNPDRRLRAVAEVEGWPILRFG